MNNIPTFKVVLARYKEDVSWLSNINKEYVICNKGPDDVPEPFNQFIEKVPYTDTGREAQSYVQYIVNNYEQLPDYIAFTQANPFDHCGNFIEVVNNFQFNEDYIRLGNCINEPFQSETDIGDLYRVFFNDSGRPLSFSGGQQFIVNKKKILLRPKSAYNELLVQLYNKDSQYYKRNHFQFAGAVERIWEQIFNENLPNK